MNDILFLRNEFLQAQRKVDLAYGLYCNGLTEVFNQLVPKINLRLNNGPYNITGFQIEQGEIELLINCACESLEEFEGDRIERYARRELEAVGLKDIVARLASGYYGL
jgi:hypothetical protein